MRTQAIELLDHAFKDGFSVDTVYQLLMIRITRRPESPSHTYCWNCLGSNPCAFRGRFQIFSMVLAEGVDLRLPVVSRRSCVPSWRVEASQHVPRGLSKATGIEATTLKRILGVFHRLEIIETMDHSGSTTADVASKREFAFEHLIPVVTNAVLDEKLETARNESSFTSEQFKNLKVQLGEASIGTRLRVFTVSSPESQDGKSLSISANLAFSFSMDPGRRVIIVDCDLRSPSIHKYLGVTSEPGLLQYLSNSHLGPHCYMRRLENLYFMTAGGVAPNPIEILSMNKVKQLVETLKRDFDTIILDAPPYAPIADARIVTGLSDGLIMVIRRGKTSYSSADRAFKAINPKKLLGVVFNDVKPMLFHTYHNFGYYGYGANLEALEFRRRQKPQQFEKLP